MVATIGYGSGAGSRQGCHACH